MKSRIIFDKDNCRVVSEHDDHILYTGYVTCPDEVIEAVVTIFNTCPNEFLLGSEGIIDQYLLHCLECSQEDREEITEAIDTYIKRS